MILPEEIIEEIEYYECYTGITSYQMDGKPIQKDKIIIHPGEWTKEWKLFGITVWSKTVEDRKKTFRFTRKRIVKDSSEGLYSFTSSEEFLQVRQQLEAHFEYDCREIFESLRNHEISYMK